MVFSNTPRGALEGRLTDPPLPGLLLPVGLTALAVVAAIWLMVAVTGFGMLALPLVLLWGGLGLILFVLAREMSGDVDYATDEAELQGSGAMVIAHPARRVQGAGPAQRHAA